MEDCEDCRNYSYDEDDSGNEYDTVKYQAIGHLAAESIAKKVREKLAKRKKVE